MTLPKYPDGLPLPLREGYGIEKVNQIRRTDMDVGRAVQRWEFEDVPNFPTVSWIFEEPESRLFNAWLRIVKGGWFTVRLLSDMGFEDVTARFVTSPAKAELVGRYCWKWSAQLEVEFENVLDEGWVILMPDYILKAALFDKAQNWEKAEAFPEVLETRVVDGGEARVVDNSEERVV